MFMLERKKMHPRNKHDGAYDFEKLIKACPILEKFVFLNEYGTQTIDFFNPLAVRALNKSLLMAYYGITYWNIPYKSLCPPIPGRADYIHYVSDLPTSEGGFCRDKRCHCLDVGVGSNCIYPIIGVAEYGWDFVGADICEDSLKNARKIVTCNPVLSHHVDLRLQTNCRHKFADVIRPDEYFDLTVCNPPFHDSAEQAGRDALRKLSNLKGKSVKDAVLNFGGVSNELWCDGGELLFLQEMIVESKRFAKNVGWFTTLVSKEKELPSLAACLKEVEVAEFKIIDMSQGVKTSRILAWRF